MSLGQILITVAPSTRSAEQLVSPAPAPLPSCSCVLDPSWNSWELLSREAVTRLHWVMAPSPLAEVKVRLLARALSPAHCTLHTLSLCLPWPYLDTSTGLDLLLQLCLSN